MSAPRSIGRCTSFWKVQPRESEAGRLRRSEFDFPLVDKERTWRILDVMEPISKAHNCSVARVVLAWLLTRPIVTSVILGAKRGDQLHDNLAAAELTLTDEEVSLLDGVSALPPEYPGRMLSVQDVGRTGKSERPVWDKTMTS